MICPACDTKDVRTKDTRTFVDPNYGFHYVERRRRCRSCGHEFKTIEITLEIYEEMTHDYRIS